MSGTVEVSTITLSYILTVPPNTAVGKEASQLKRVSVNGKVAQIVLFFPTGAAGTTGVFFTNEGDVVFPFEPGTDIALDSATIPFAADIPVKKGDILQLNGNNSDTVSHTIRAVVTIVTSDVRYK